jgi:ATP-dependent exoDNAse (exonuclease V) beta subunit
MLTLCRASAGTGKTHTLTGEYLRLLFAGTDVHARILSVTFTNKATEEMKTRILQELYLLSSGGKSDYLSTLAGLYGQTDMQIRTRARRILIRILHDYASFHVSTIDHFFQQTIRAFVREIGLQGNYRIEMDRDLVLSEAVDSLLAGLEKKEHRQLLEWLLRFSEDRIEHGENWDVRREIRTLAGELFKEKYKAYSEAIDRDIADKQALDRYRDVLFALIRTAEADARRLGEQGMAALEQYGLAPSDFKGGSRSAVFLFEQLAGGAMKEPSATFRAMAEQVEACCTQTMPPARRQAIEAAYAGELGECFRRTVTFFSRLANYHTAREISRHYYTLGILSDISRQIRQWCEDKNRMLIADTTELLSRVIDGSDVPFIYEKTGTHIDHYMIDEFQDTSEMQWRNFRPLVRESMAYRRDNLIVGDIKQSIYRFRNSDWTLLDGKVRAGFPAEQLSEKRLSDNWRSHRLIAEFNNTFFTVAPALLQQHYSEGLAGSALSAAQQEQFASKIRTAYGGSFLHVPPPFRTKDGHVRIELLPDGEDTDWKEEALRRLPPLVERLQDNGYALRDMAVLVRTRAEGLRVAETLLRYKSEHPGSRHAYDIISEDALGLGNSLSVQFIIRMLQCINRPDDVPAARLAQIAAILLRREKDMPLQDAFTAEAAAVFPDDMRAELLLAQRRTLYGQCEIICRLFERDFPEDEWVFVQAFLDLVIGYMEKEPPDMDRFFRWWKETGCQTKITMPDAQNAIRILTVHKSKGLGFKAVIVPFADWDADQKSGSILWCRPQEAPFNRLPLTPVSYSGSLGRTLFAEDYYHEKLHAFIDSLNALYVAFTRAKEELIVFTPDAGAGRTKAISRLIRDSLQASDVTETAEGDALQPFAGGFRSDGVFEWGDWWQTCPAREQPVEEMPAHRLPTVSPEARIHLRLHRRNAFFGDEARRRGLLMHELLSAVRTHDDIRAAVTAKVSAGEISRKEAGELTGRLETLLRKEQVRTWFDGSLKVMNEAEILLEDGRSRRPDRVMTDGRAVHVVDYKFGERKETRHRRQVDAYCSLIRRMGYTAVTGYLWYVTLDEIETV